MFLRPKVSWNSQLHKSIRKTCLISMFLSLYGNAKISESYSNFIEEELIGFAGNWKSGDSISSPTNGGKEGNVYEVTSLGDSEDCSAKTDWSGGTLRCGAESLNKYWIIFKVSGIVALTKDMFVTSNKTIDGRGADISISENSIRIGNCIGRSCEEGLYSVKNVIITNLKFVQKNNRASAKAIKIWGSKNIWIHHCTFNKWEDGMIYMRWKATNITLSWNKFENLGRPKSKKGHYHRAVLIGVGSGKGTKGTMHNNYFKNILNRTPRVDLKSFVHVYNNYFEGTIQYNVASLTGAQVYLESNIFESGGKKSQYIICQRREFKPGKIKSLGNGFDKNIEPYWFVTGVDECRGEEVETPISYYAYEAKKANEILKKSLIERAGYNPNVQ